MNRAISVCVKKIVFSCVFCAIAYSNVQISHADSGQRSLSPEARKSLAQAFVKKIKSGMQAADQRLIKVERAHIETNILPEGERLLLQPSLPPHIKPDGIIMGQSRNKRILLSLKDFGSTLQLPIDVNAETRTADGWYIRQNKKFHVDMAKGIAHTDVGKFPISENVIFEDGDIWVPVEELAQWIDFDMTTRISAQTLAIKPSSPLPLQERLNRRKFDAKNNNRIPEPKLPRGGEPYKMVSAPSIDVSTNSTYRKSGDRDDGDSRHDVNVRTVNDLAYGTFTTQTQYDDENQIRNIRANYKQESENPDLLGPLKARRFEVGDVVTVPTQLLGGAIKQELGARITNTDPLRSFSSPSTSITGNTFPGWDVELYRENQLIGFQAVRDDGFYNFENVILFNSDNNFRLVFYGPQGEVREESLSIPVDNKLLAEKGGVYDVSVTFDGKQAYKKDVGFAEPDEGAANIVALYERPILDRTSASVGFRSSEHEGERNSVAQVGLSTTIMQALVNADVAVDDEGEAAAELVTRRSFANHDIVNTLSWTGENFDTDSRGDTNDIGTFRESFSMIGELPFELGKRPRYNLSASYTENTEGNSTFSSTAGFNTAIKRFTFNESVTYNSSDTIADDTINSLTSVTGVYGKNRMRVLANYNIKPDSELSRVLATYQRDFSRDVDVTLDLERRFEQSLTELTARLDWQAGFARISPRISYNSDHDVFAGLSTRFGLLKDPTSGDPYAFDRPITSSGSVSALVYVDENGDGQFNEGEETLEDVTVHALQNGGREKTDENGIAIFTRMQRQRLTDVIVDANSLKDPAWIPGFEGVSILPREGYTAKIEFPVHISGELDGVLYANVKKSWLDDDLSEAEPVPLRNVSLSLYNTEGEAEKTAVTDSGGFYYFTQVPPGRYLLAISSKSAARNNFIRPMPQQIEIGYDGTIIYGNDIYVDSGSDVPSEIKADIEDYQTRHPHIDFSAQDYDLVLNLGEYNSRLLMSVVWYKLKSRYNAMIGHGDLFVPPTQSYADVTTGKHTLRVGLKNKKLDHAYAVCRSLMARDQQCSVEIFPTYIKQASAVNP